MDNNHTAVLMIDGENFFKKVREVILKSGEKIEDYDLCAIDLRGILSGALEGVVVSKTLFYSAKLHANPETRVKSQELIDRQRALKLNLEKQGIDFVTYGNVRSYPDRHPRTGEPGLRKPVFKEKGVDVGMAVDAVSWGYEKKYDHVVLATSDSDIQPVVKKCRDLGLWVTYLGFEFMPNKGLTATCGRTILLRTNEILNHIPKVQRQVLEPALSI